MFVGQGHVMDNIELTQPKLKHLESCLLMRNVAGKFQDVTQQSGEALSCRKTCAWCGVRRLG